MYLIKLPSELEVLEGMQEAKKIVSESLCDYPYQGDYRNFFGDRSIYAIDTIILSNVPASQNDRGFNKASFTNIDPSTRKYILSLALEKNFFVDYASERLLDGYEKSTRVLHMNNFFGVTDTTFTPKTLGKIWKPVFDVICKNIKCNVHIL